MGTVEKFRETSNNNLKMTKPAIQNRLLGQHNYQKEVHHADIPRLLKHIQNRLHKSILRKVRQAITGDPERIHQTG